MNILEKHIDKFVTTAFASSAERKNLIRKQVKNNTRLCISSTLLFIIALLGNDISTYFLSLLMLLIFSFSCAMTYILKFTDRILLEMEIAKSVSENEI